MSDAAPVENRGGISLRETASRIENFASGRKNLVAMFHLKDWDLAAATKKIIEQVSDPESQKRLIKAAKIYETKRKEVDRIWDKYTPGKQWDGGVGEFDDDAAMQMFVDLTGKESLGQVKAIRTDMTIHMDCAERIDINQLIEKSNVDKRGSVSDGRARISNFSSTGGVVLNLGFEENSSREIITASREESDRESIKQIASHERNHLEDLIFASAKILGTPEFSRFEKLVQQPEFIELEKKVKALPEKENALAITLAKNKLLQAIAMVFGGDLDRGIFTELRAYYKDGHAAEELLGLIEDYDFGEFGYLLEKYWLATKKEKMNGVQLITETISQEYNAMYKRLKETGVYTYTDLIKHYHGDEEMAAGVLMPFTMKDWPTIAKLVTRYGKATI